MTSDPPKNLQATGDISTYVHIRLGFILYYLFAITYPRFLIAFSFRCMCTSCFIFGVEPNPRLYTTVFLYVFIFAGSSKSEVRYLLASGTFRLFSSR